MFNFKHYVPILKSKRAEYVALGDLSPSVKKTITPLIDVISVPWDHKIGKPQRTLKEHLDHVAKNIVGFWGAASPIFIDLMYVASDDKAINGKQSLTYFCESIRSYGVRFIPTTGLDRTDIYQSAVKECVDEKNGLCFRIRQEDLDDLDSLGDSLAALINDFKIALRYCDIILDFEALPIKGVGDQAAYIRNIVNNFPKVSEWRTFTIAASNFPQFLTELKADSEKLLPRSEYLLWKDIVTKSDKPSRLPSFGDYAIQHPAMEDVDFSNKKMSVNLRYTTKSHWLVFKGREKNRYGYEQFNKICGSLIGKSEFYGPSFSTADGYIARCAHDLAGPGSPEIWRRVGFNHHITVVAKQISSSALS